MKKIFFDQGVKTPTSSSNTSRTSQRDSSQVSSRWKEVSEKKSPTQTRVEKKRSGTQQPKKRQHLSKGKQSVDFNEDDSNTSPFDLFNNLETRRKQPAVGNNSLPEGEIEGDQVMGAFAEESGQEIDLSNLLAPSKDDKIVAMSEDMSFMKPTAKSASIASIQPSTDGVSSKISPKTVSLIEELMHKIADEITVMKGEGRTETTVTLKHPPMFSGAQVTITEFDSAKKEFNIKFENLSQEAHELISMQSNLDTLKSGLQQKGLNVHIVTANTEIEQPEHVYEGYNDRDGSDKHEESEHSHQDQDQDHDGQE
jgi:hypothetical protein